MSAILAGKLLIGLSLIVIFSHTTTTVAQPDFLFWDCVEEANYTANSTYKTNLDRNLDILPTTNSGFGFFNLSTGQENDTVYSIALCRGDVEPSACQSCLNDSIVKLRGYCPYEKEAIGYYDNCMLIYSNQIISENTQRYSFYYPLFNPQNSPEITRFNDALRPLLAELRGRAAGGGPLLKFATGNTPGPGLSTIYALMQCTPDLSERRCDGCLEDAINRMSFLNYSYGKIGGRILLPVCNFRYELDKFFNESNVAIPTPPSSPPISQRSPPPPTPSDKKNNLIVIIITIIVTVVVVITIASVFMFMRSTKKKRQILHPPPYESIQIETMDIGNAESFQFNFSTIKSATNDFSEENKLGQGGFGAVYKGKLEDGHKIAVKRLDMYSSQGDGEFKNEVLILAKLQHRNLVRLLGFSIDGSERLLIYEFLPNGSLDQFISDSTKRTLLDWEKRYNIIKGIAKGLLYLHEDSRLKIIHRDMKASNVLLDAEMNPKIADFGMARLFKLEETHAETSRIVGTYGYMAPEYAIRGQFSVKSDVFSFGVLILEMVTGQKNQCFGSSESIEDLLGFTWKSWRNGTTTNIIDPTLRSGSGSLRDIIRSIHIGLLCVQENVIDRPTMAAVVLMLNSISITLPVPSEPALFMPSNIDSETPLVQDHNSLTGSSRLSLSKSRPSQYSINDVSFSEFVPR